MAKHTPVLLSAILQHSAEIPFSEGLFLDGTLGRGGHLRAILDQFPASRAIGLDQDAQALEEVGLEMKAYIDQGRLELHRSNFSDFERHLAGRPLAGAILDLGVSSPQLDQAHRGFSFYNDGPLDMRMNQSQELSAAVVVNQWSEPELIEIFRTYGEVRRPDRAARALVEQRRETPFQTTLQLAKFFEKLDGWYRKGHHPATNYFQAIRIAVNDELGVLERTLPKLVEALLPNGRLMVITFHSLEDRIAKYAFKDLEKAGVAFAVNKKVIQPTWDEQKGNPRSRSAKLRVIQKGQRK